MLMRVRERCKVELSVGHVVMIEEEGTYICERVWFG